MKAALQLGGWCLRVAARL